MTSLFGRDRKKKIQTEKTVGKSHLVATVCANIFMTRRFNAHMKLNKNSIFNIRLRSIASTNSSFFSFFSFRGHTKSADHIFTSFLIEFNSFLMLLFLALRQHLWLQHRNRVQSLPRDDPKRVHEMKWGNFILCSGSGRVNAMRREAKSPIRFH